MGQRASRVPAYCRTRVVRNHDEHERADTVMRVVVAGGGIAALEVLAGLRALAGDRVHATLLAPEAFFSYRPLSTAVPFTFREERRRTLDELASGLGAAFVRDGLAQVDAARRRIL